MNLGSPAVEPIAQPICSLVKGEIPPATAESRKIFGTSHIREDGSQLQRGRFPPPSVHGNGQSLKEAYGKQSFISNPIGLIQGLPVKGVSCWSFLRSERAAAQDGAGLHHSKDLAFWPSSPLRAHPPGTFLGTTCSFLSPFLCTGSSLAWNVAPVTLPRSSA